MRHNRDEKRFDRTYSHLKSMLSNMTNDLVMYGRIRTTTPKAKVLRSYAEKMITLGKDGSVAARRRAMAFMRNKAAVTRLFDAVAPQFKERNGGYTRILKLGNRPGDNAAMAIIELVEGQQAAAAIEAPKKKAAVKKTAKAPAAEKKAAPAKEKKEAAPKKAAAPRKKAAAAEGEKEAKPAVKRTRKKATESES
ncbi:50S ribosomal protein L17 [uncultured bacterium]|nr:50S ribosomal protein L17 [uncultured bacterium]